MIGSTIDGKYQIQKLLGEGAMGAVYAAEHAATGRRVAVKVISSADLTKDPMIVSRFQREARAAGAIDTQHITQVLDAGVDRESGLPFLAMEYMVGEDVMALIKRVGPIAPDLALRITAQACLGLQKAHEAKVVHRDIKPHNLFLCRRDAGEVIVKLLDFGIAKVKMDQANDTGNAELTRTGNLLGSPLYMSPEQARGQKEIDLRTDIWSLGAVLYQALTGRTPYHHITALGQLIIAICSEPPPSVQHFAPWVAPEIAAIVHRCLQQDPGRRFQSAAEMFEAIRPLLPYGWGIHQDQLVSLQDSVRNQAAPRLPVSMLPPSMQTGSNPAISAASIAVGAATTGALTASQSQSVSQPRSSKAGAAIVAIALFLLGAGGGVYFFTRQSTLQPQPQVTAPAPPPVPTETNVTTVAPPPSNSGTTTVLPVVEPPLRRVEVVIQPADASVEVENAQLEMEKTSIKDGILELKGSLGKVFKVRVVKGTGQVTTDVFITDMGPKPARIEVKPGITTTTTRSPPPTTSPSALTGFKDDRSEFDKKQ